MPSALQVRSVVAADFQVTCASTQNTQKTSLESRLGSVPGQVQIGKGPPARARREQLKREKTRRKREARCPSPKAVPANYSTR